MVPSFNAKRAHRHNPTLSPPLCNSTFLTTVSRSKQTRVSHPYSSPALLRAIADASTSVMSQGESQRRKKTILKDADSNRMPFEAAEALLWGKATYDQHDVLYKGMKELQSRHEAYETRIRAAESITEAAEAATSRMRCIEERVKAIEDDDQDQPVINWVTAELNPLKAFVHENKNLRQRQIELEKRLSDATENIDRVRHISTDIHTLRQQVNDLEAQRSSDADQIEKLWRIVGDLTTAHDTQGIGSRSPRGKLMPTITVQRNPKSQSKPARQAPLNPSDPAEETEDEDLFAAPIHSLSFSEINKDVHAVATPGTR